jgi:hypothetical protein
MQPPKSEENTFPKARLTNGILDAELYLPNTDKGYYRGVRFDWSGVIPHLDYKGHNFFGKWNPAPHDPYYHDAIMGPVEEFSEIGFDNALAEELFLKIGVGALLKPDDEPCSFLRYYQISNPGRWRVTEHPDYVEFIHELSDAAGYSYEYCKTILLVSGQPEMVINHSLKNTGIKAIETSVYNHNFFVIDQEPTNQNILTTFPFEIQAEGLGFGTIAHAQDRSIVYDRPLKEGENAFCGDIRGFGATPKDYNILIQNLKSGAEVRITGDQPIEKLIYWSCPTSSCPEPYTKLSVQPGDVKTWRISYEFSVQDHS